MTDLQTRLAALTPEKRALLARRLQEGKAQGIPRWTAPGPPPLSFAQERLWFLDRLAPGTPAYNMPLALAIEGPLDRRALERGLYEVVRRHAVLRSTFVEQEGRPVQVVAPSQALPLPVVDLEALPPSRHEPEVERLTLEEIRRPFDLATGPVIRTLLLREGSARHVLILTLHHVATDGWSLQILGRETAALAAVFAQGKPSPLPELPIQYHDFAAWQRSWLSGEVLERQLGYWRHQLAGLPALLELPTDRPRPPVQTNAGQTLEHPLPADLVEALRAFTQERGATPFMTLLASFHALLARMSGQRQVCVGAPAAGRTRREVEGLIGLFVNTLVLCVRFDGDFAGGPVTFGGLVDRVREVTLDAHGNQDVPFEKLVEELHPARSLGHSPLFQVMFDLVHAKPPVELSSGLRMTALSYDFGIAKFDLTLTVAEEPGGALGAGFEYNSDLFDAATVARLAGCWERLLDQMVRHPKASIDELPLLTPGEQAEVISLGHGAGTTPVARCLHELFEEQARRDPVALALVEGTERVSYGDLDARANRLARELRAQGVGIDVPVGLFLERGIGLIVAILGVLKAGGAYLPLDPTYPPERLAHLLEDSRVPLLVTREPLLARLPAGARPGLRDLCLDRDAEQIGHHGSTPPEPFATPGSLAYVMYTSGTTGRPKGVMIPHRAAAWYAAVAVGHYGIVPADRVLQLSSISFDISVEEIFACLAGGAALVFPSAEARHDARRLLAECAEAGVSVMSPPTAFWHELVPEAVAHPELVPASLRLVILGGEKVLPERVAQWQERLGERVALINTYGPTETSVVAALHPVSGPWPRSADVPLGRPVRGARVHVLDPSFLPQPAGVPGEAFIGGAGLGRGYLGRPDLTAERFVPDPFREPGGRLYRTGDRVRWRAGGLLEFLGRIDGQVKVRGFRVEPGEVEAVIVEQPGVREAAVVVWQEAAGDRRLVACVVLDGGTAGELREALKQRLPDYMVPTRFVVLERLPLTPHGKVDRRALSALIPDGIGSDSPRVPPRDLLELELARVWEQALGVSPVGVRDDFFALGGHSLLAVRLLAAVRERFGRSLPLAALFQGGTVERMAGLLRGDGAEVLRSCLVPIQAAGAAPPFFCIHGVGGDVLSFAALARHLGPDQPFYGLRSRGLAGEGEPLATIGEMAALYLEEIRTVQPGGPYRLGGWSLGGLIALEMARRLCEQGEEVAPLILLDSSPAVVGAGSDEDDGIESLLAIAAYARVFWGGELEVTREDLEAAASADRLGLLLDRLRTAGILPPGGEPLVRDAARVYAANSRAARTWSLPSVDVPAVLLKAEGSAAAAPRPDFGWSAVVSGPVDVRTVPGGHLTMLAEPFVGGLAECLRGVLAS